MIYKTSIILKDAIEIVRKNTPFLADKHVKIFQYLIFPFFIFYSIFSYIHHMYLYSVLGISFFLFFLFCFFVLPKKCFNPPISKPLEMQISLEITDTEITFYEEEEVIKHPINRYTDFFVVKEGIILMKLGKKTFSQREIFFIPISSISYKQQIINLFIKQGLIKHTILL